MPDTTPEQAVIQAALLPCPFCGASAHMSQDAKTGYFGPDANHAGTCPINLDFRDYADREQAAREWNTRLAHNQPASEGLREALIGPGDRALENVAQLGRFGWLEALICDLKDCPEAMSALRKEDPDATFEAMREVDDLIRDVRAALQPLTEPQRLGQEGEGRRALIAAIIEKRVSSPVFLGETAEAHQRDRLAAADEIIAALSTTAQAEPVALDAYDAGLLNDFGGGDVDWWQDYIRAELGRAHDFYAAQLPADPPASLQDREAVVDVLQDLFLKGWEAHSGGSSYYPARDTAVDAALPLLAEERGERS